VGKRISSFAGCPFVRTHGLEIGIPEDSYLKEIAPDPELVLMTIDGGYMYILGCECSPISH